MLTLFGVTRLLELILAVTERRWGTLWSGYQSITALTQRDSHSHLQASLLSPINLPAEETLQHSNMQTALREAPGTQRVWNQDLLIFYAFIQEYLIWMCYFKTQYNKTVNSSPGNISVCRYTSHLTAIYFSGSQWWLMPFGLLTLWPDMNKHE